MQNFSELPISSYTKERLLAARFTIPTPVQAAAIPQALEGKDVMATAQTGTGKTLAFLVPIIEKLLAKVTPGIGALVLVPTRELAMQVVEQYNVLRGKQLAPAGLVVGGLAEGNQLNAIRKGARFVVATPGRLEDYLDRKLFHFNALHTLVLDEADRMLDMGFLPAIQRIVAVLPKERQTLCFSATLEGSIVRLVKDYLRNPVRLAFGSTSKPAESVKLQAFEVTADGKHEMLYHLLTKDTGRCLVFSRTKRGVDRIAKKLEKLGHDADVIHGDRSQSQRTSALTGFQQGRFRVLVATDVASRGIHVQDIAHVINYDLPDVAENFIHRVGRTGRAGGSGIASTLFVKEQRSELFQLERALGIRIERLRPEIDPAEKVARAAAAAAVAAKQTSRPATENSGFRRPVSGANWGRSARSPYSRSSSGSSERSSSRSSGGSGSRFSGGGSHRSSSGTGTSGRPSNGHSSRPSSRPASSKATGNDRDEQPTFLSNDDRNDSKDRNQRYAAAKRRSDRGSFSHPHTPSASNGRMAQLPGEILQARLDS